MHVPVLLQVSTAGLGLKPGETVLDCTLGLGGHASEFCKLVGPTGLVIGLDQDEEAASQAREKIASCPCRFNLEIANFRELGHVLSKVGIPEVDAVFMDLGLNSEQLEKSGRGFTFQKDEPLLMTFTTRPAANALTAEEIVNTWSPESLEAIIKAYGEERFSWRIAQKIAEARQKSPIKTTKELVEVIRQAVPSWYTTGRLHFATRTFQALRMTVNDELGALKVALKDAWAHLKIGGRLGVITFHGLEAKIVKDFFNEKTRSDEAEKVTKRPIRPEREEIKKNPRSRSAQLRIIKKLK